jgi:hypothetical protein
MSDIPQRPLIWLHPKIIAVGSNAERELNGMATIPRPKPAKHMEYVVRTNRCAAGNEQLDVIELLLN